MVALNPFDRLVLEKRNDGRCLLLISSNEGDIDNPHYTVYQGNLKVIVNSNHSDSGYDNLFDDGS